MLELFFKVHTDEDKQGLTSLQISYWSILNKKKWSVQLIPKITVKFYKLGLGDVYLIGFWRYPNWNIMMTSVVVCPLSSCTLAYYFTHCRSNRLISPSAENGLQQKTTNYLFTMPLLSGRQSFKSGPNPLQVRLRMMRNLLITYIFINICIWNLKLYLVPQKQGYRHLLELGWFYQSWALLPEPWPVYPL